MQKGPYFNPVQYISPLPEGYLQASSNIANTLGKAVQGFGENIASGIEKYTKNKEESALLDSQAPILLADLKKRAEASKNTEDIARFQKMGDQLSKMPGQSVAQKRATVSGFMTELSLYDKRQQFEINQNQLEAQRQAEINRQAYTQSFGGPTTRDVQSQLAPRLRDQSQYLYDQSQQATQQAQPGFMNSLAAMQANAPQSSAAPIAQPQVTQVNPAAFAQQANGSSLNAQTTMFGNPTYRDINSYSNKPNNALSSFNEKMTYGIIDNFMDASAAVKGISKMTGIPNAVLKTAGVVDRLSSVNYSPNNPTRRDDILAAFNGSPEMPTKTQVAPQAPVSAPISAQQPVAAQRNLPSASQFDQSFNQNIDRVGQTPERTVTNRVDLTPKELYTNQLASYIAKGGQITPELNAQFKKDAGVKVAVDVKVQNINGVTVITQDGDVKYVLPPVVEKGATPGDLLTAQRDFESRFVKVGNRSFQAPTSQEGIKMRTTIKDHDLIRSGLTQLISLADDPSVKVKTSDAYNKANTISTMLQGALRTTITGPGAVNESEYKMLRDVIANPSSFFSLSSSNKKVLQTLLSRVDDNLNAEIKSLGGVDVTGANIGSVNDSGSNQGTLYYSTTGNQKK